MLQIGRHAFRAIVDTGADVSICTRAVANNKTFEPFEWPTTTLLQPDGNYIPVSDAVQGVIRYRKAYISTSFVVTPQTLPEEVVIGGVTLIALHDKLGPAQLENNREYGFSMQFIFDEATPSTRRQIEATAELRPKRFKVPDHIATDIAMYPTRTYVAGRIRAETAIGRWDTVAPRSLCRTTTAFKYGIKQISAEEPLIRFPNGNVVPSIGIASIHFETAHFTGSLEVLVVPDAAYNGNEDILLGLDWTAEAASRCNFKFNISRKELFLDEMDIAVKKDGEAIVYDREHSHLTTTIHRKDTTAPARKRTRNYRDLSLKRTGTEQSREEGHDENVSHYPKEKSSDVEQLEQEAKQQERPSDAEITQLLTEASHAIELMSQRLDAAYQIGERLVEERNEERREKEEWKNRAARAEDAAKYWSQGFADLSAKVRDEQRKNPKDAIGNDEQARQQQEKP